jgi:trehalose synthase-fused probable maltokinase
VHVISQFDELFSGDARAEVETRLGSYIEARRWFRSKTRALAGISLAHVVPLPIPGTEVVLAVAGMRYEQGSDEEYVLPLTWIHGDDGDHLAQTKPHLVVGAIDVSGEERPRWLVDALGVPHALEGLLALVAREASARTPGCTLTFRRIEGAPAGFEATATPRPVVTEQSNTSIVFGEACILKIVRKLEDGPSPDMEVGEFLTHAGYAHTPPLLAAIELERPGRPAATVGMVHAFVANHGDAWTQTVDAIVRAGTGGELSALEESLVAMRRLATRVAEMHAVLASPTTDARFAPELIDASERQALGLAVERALEAACALVEAHADHLAHEDLARLRHIRERASAYQDCVARFVADGFRCMKTRVHGDLHLGQVLSTGDDVVLIDFEGEPARPLVERRAKRSPAVDVAGMLRSLHYASIAAARARPPLGQPMTEFAERWHQLARREFLRAYQGASQGTSVLPQDAASHDVLLRFCLLEKCVYELHYELNNRPDWVAIPLRGLENVLEELHAP